MTIIVLPVYPFILVCYERDFVLSVSYDKQADIFDAFKDSK